MKIFVINFLIFFSSPTFGFECGKVQQAAGLIIGGSATSIERWPFSASLHYGDKHSFYCGGTIISQQHVITSKELIYIFELNDPFFPCAGASCIQRKYGSEAMSSESVKVSVGQTDITKLPAADFLSVEKIIIHPDWSIKTKNYDGNIAIIVLEKNLVFSKKVQPACIPTDNSIALITDGYMVSFMFNKTVKINLLLFFSQTGWGRKDSYIMFEPIIQYARMEAVNDTECFHTNPELTKFASNRTFCADGKGNGPCFCDTGKTLLDLK